MNALREASILHLQRTYGLSRMEISSMYGRMGQGYTPFHKAILYKHLFKLVQLCEEGANPFQYNWFKESPAMLYANTNRFSARNYEIIGVLVRAMRRWRASILIQRWVRTRSKVYLLAIHMTFKGVYTDKIQVPPDITRNMRDYLWSLDLRKRKYVPRVPLISHQMREPSNFPLTRIYYVGNNPFKTKVRWARQRDPLGNREVMPFPLLQAQPRLTPDQLSLDLARIPVVSRIWQIYGLVPQKGPKFYYSPYGKDRYIPWKDPYWSPKRLKRRKYNFQKR